DRVDQRVRVDDHGLWQPHGALGDRREDGRLVAVRVDRDGALRVALAGLGVDDLRARRGRCEHERGDQLQPHPPPPTPVPPIDPSRYSWTCVSSFCSSGAACGFIVARCSRWCACTRTHPTAPANTMTTRTAQRAMGDELPM